MKKKGILVMLVLLALLTSGCNDNQNQMSSIDKKEQNEVTKTPVSPTSQPGPSSEPSPTTELSPTAEPSLTVEPSLTGEPSSTAVLSPTISGSSSEYDESLCREDEEILFSFHLTDSRKVVSICLSKNQPSYIVYRFGTAENIELEYPDDLSHSYDLFTYSYYLRGGGQDNESLDLNHLTFETEDYTYTLSEEYSYESSTPLVKIVVHDRKTNKDTELIGDNSTLIGTLIDLRENPDITVVFE